MTYVPSSAFVSISCLQSIAPSPLRRSRIVPCSRPLLLVPPYSPSSFFDFPSFPLPPASSLNVRTPPFSNYLRTAVPTVSHVLSSPMTGPIAPHSSALALVAYVTNFASNRRLDCVTQSVSSTTHPQSVGVGPDLGCDVLEERQFELAFLTTAAPHICAMLLAPNTVYIPSPCTYAEVVSGEWASKWIVDMDAEMTSWSSTGTYVNVFSPPGANTFDGMWIFKVKRLPGSSPVFKARYVAKAFSLHKKIYLY
ncbi:unnamed protein product [Closterium sp. NIES-53]